MELGGLRELQSSLYIYQKGMHNYMYMYNNTCACICSDTIFYLQFAIMYNMYMYMHHHLHDLFLPVNGLIGLLCANSAESKDRSICRSQVRHLSGTTCRRKRTHCHTSPSLLVIRSIIYTT